jgi:alanyl-tRNA synthetase
VVSVGSPDGVEIYDASACCGTHLRATGEVGPIHIRRWERRKGQTRIEFLCGWRALRSQRAQNAICQALAGRLTVAVADLPQVLQRLTDREQEQGKQLQELRKRLLAFEAPRLDEQAEVRGGLRVLCRLLDGYDVANMRALAQTLTQQPDRVALLAVTDPAPQICFARSQNVNLDMAALLRHASAPYGGRGGGSPQLATGGGVAAGDLAKVLAAASAQFGCTDGR